MQFDESIGHNYWNNKYISRCLCSFWKMTCHLEIILNQENAVPYSKISLLLNVSLGPQLTNIVMTELEEKFIKSLINGDTTTFYARYVDNILVKCKDVRRIQNLLQNFDSKLHLTIYAFQNEAPHFLDLELFPDGMLIFRKNRNTNLYTHFSSCHWTAWIKSLSSCTSHVCSPNKLSSGKNFIKKLKLWNGFNRPVVKSIIHQVLNKKDKSTDDAELPEVLTIYICMPYYGNKAVSCFLCKIWSNCIKTRSIIQDSKWC